MRRSATLFGLLLSLALLLAPEIGHARIGSGLSLGSRGSRTYAAPPVTGTSPYGASPMQRSLTQPGGYGSNGGYAGSSGYGGYGRPGFGTGLAAGFLGFGLMHALFGGYGGGYGNGGMGLFGLLIRVLIVGFLVRWLFRRFFRPGGAPSVGMPGLFAPRMATGPSYNMGGGPALAGPPVAIQPADYHAFEAILKNIQAAWSNADLNALRTMASPEMLSYFAEQLADNASRGRRNVVADVKLQKGDLSESWSESGRTYATVAMRFSMTDTTYDQSGRIVDGSPNEHVSVSEYWTFLRAPGGQWMLSAIQQAR